MKKPVLILMAVIASALVVWLAENPFRPERGDLFSEPFFRDFDSGSIARIEVSHLLNGVQLQKGQGNWLVAALTTQLKQDLEKQGQATKPASAEPQWFAADPQKLELALDSLAELQATSLAGENPERHGFFEVNAAGMEIKAFDASNKKRLHFFVGKTGPAFTESYIRRDGENEVYLGNRFLRSSFPPDANAWRDRTVWDIPPDSIEQIEVTGGKESYTLRKEATDWKLQSPAGKTLDPAKVSKMVQAVAKIVAKDFVETPDEKMGLNPPEKTLRLVTATGVYSLLFGKKNEYLEPAAQKPGEPQIYLLRETTDQAIPLNWKGLTAE